MALVRMIAMDNIGTQFDIYVDPGNAPSETLVQLLTSLSDLHAAGGGLGFLFRPAEEKRPWQEGVPPTAPKPTIWIVKVQGYTIHPSEKVVVAVDGVGFVFLHNYYRRKTNPEQLEITHYRPLTPEENLFLILP